VSDRYVLDSFAVLTLLGQEVGSEEVTSLLRQAQEGKIDLLMTWVNLGEVAYIVKRRWGEERLYQALAFLEATKIAIVPVGRRLTLRAAHIKAAYPMAYADTFAVALAVEEVAELVTGDSKFEALEDFVSIRWLS
jgi:ribonuclease VapC